MVSDRATKRHTEWHELFWMARQIDDGNYFGFRKKIYQMTRSTMEGYVARFKKCKPDEYIAIMARRRLGIE